MCYAKPGPRCSAHAAVALKRAYNMQGISQEQLFEAIDNYDETPAGRQRLLRSISRLPDNSTKRLKVQASYDAALRRYEQKIERYHESEKERRKQKQVIAPPQVLFRTLHGSHLYGLNHADSDTDYFEIIVAPERSTIGQQRKGKTKQTIVDGIDMVRIGLGTWMDKCNEGVPQALEAMMSPHAENENDSLGSLRSSYRIDVDTMRNTYRRTITNFSMGDKKRRAHALRLALNYEEASRLRRFNPRLTPEQVDFVRKSAVDKNYLDILVKTFPYITKEKLIEEGYVLEGEDLSLV